MSSSGSNFSTDSSGIFRIYRRPSIVNTIIAIVILVTVGAVFLACFLRIYVMVMRRQNEEAEGQRSEEQQQAKRGLEDDQIKALPQRRYDPESEGEGECTVCLDQFQDGDLVKCLPPCGHIFHQDCVDKWLAVRHTCPICRISLRPSDGGDDKEACPPEMDQDMEQQGEGQRFAVGGREQQEVRNEAQVGESDPDLIALGCRAEQNLLARDSSLSGYRAGVSDGRESLSKLQLEDLEMGRHAEDQSQQQQQLLNRQLSPRSPLHTPAHPTSQVQDRPEMSDEELLTVFRQERRSALQSLQGR